MELLAIECPFTPQQMVMVLTLDSGNEGIGVALMESLLPEERRELFDALAWYRENRNWDRRSYCTVSDGSSVDEISRWEESVSAIERARKNLGYDE